MVSDSISYPLITSISFFETINYRKPFEGGAVNSYHSRVSTLPKDESVKSIKGQVKP